MKKLSLLSSLDGHVRAIDCQIDRHTIEIGCLCLNAIARASLKDAPKIVDLYDCLDAPSWSGNPTETHRCTTYITTIELPQSFAGNKNGYLPDTTLKCLPPQN